MPADSVLVPVSTSGSSELETTTTPQPQQPKPYQVAAQRVRSSFDYVFKEKQLHRRFWLWFGLSAGGGAVVLLSTWQRLEQSLPATKGEIETFAQEKTMVIKATDGSILQEIGPVTHEYLDIKQISPNIKHAFIASEDRRFEEHGGVDYWGIARAVVVNLRAADVVEGGSTIAQQLARIVFLDRERHVWRKLREMRLAQQIEKDYSKDEILERYLNLVYLGSGSYGVSDAAWNYFGKSGRDLTVPEAAMLAGMAPAPSLYSPLENKDKALERRNVVLQRMAEAKFLTPEEAKKAIASPIVLNPKQPKRLERKEPYFTEYIQKQIPKYLTPKEINEGGIVVETTLHPAWQRAATKAVKNAVENYGGSSNFKQAALVAIDPRNGEIRAMVGGKDYEDKKENGQFNRATLAKRQPGSTFKTFVYSTAIAAGFSPYDGLRDDPLVVDGYTPKNYDEKYQGWLSMRDALVNSRNIPAVKMLIQVGWDPVVKMAKQMGLESPLNKTYSLALGSSEVTLLELTSAYGTLANQGVHWPAIGIRRIVDRKGKVLYQSNPKPVKALDEDSANIMTWLLRQVVESGTGTAAQIGRPAAGKTGTTDKARDLWFVGYVPQLVAGVWLGNDNNEPTWGASSLAAGTWENFMEDTIEWFPEEKFPPRPEQIEGRKGTIKAQPIQPKVQYYKELPKPKNEEDSEANSNSDSDSGSSRRSRRRRSYNSDNSDSDSGNYTPPRRSRRSRSSDSDESSSSGSSERSSRRSRRSYNSDESEAPRRQRSRSSSDESGSSSSSGRSRSSSGDSSGEGSSSSSRRSRSEESAPAPAPVPEISKPEKSVESAPADSAAPSGTE
ncbi:penicillin-binding protein 1A [Oscillatoria sp. FACHB-1406]|nr:penicillin-binding protein 1A [Oscillatoria sp. FACHB-1406]